MKIKKLLTIFLALLPLVSLAEFTAKFLQEKSMQNVDIIKKIADATEAWQSEKAQLNARLKTQETLNNRLKKEISETKEKSEKSGIASAEILASLEKFKAFEIGLESALKESTKNFLAKIKNPPAIYVLKNQLGLDGTYKDVYAYAESAIEARAFALEASRELRVKNIDGEEALLVGISAVLKKSNCLEISEIIDILNGKSPHKIISISVEGGSK